jgi:hypothetical protein
MALEKFRAPALPVPSLEYDQRQQTDLIRALRIYFNWLDSLTPNQAESYRANLFIGGEFEGNFTGGTVTASTISGTNADVDRLYADYIRSNGFLGGGFVGNNIMGSDFYGGRFYGDGKYIATPYNQLISNTDQAAGALGTAYAVTYDTTDFPDGITITSGSRITFADTGVYNITYSIQFENDNNTTETVDIWLRYKGTDIAGTNSRFSLPPRKSVGVPSTLIAVTPIMVDVEADGDYIQIMWHPSDLGVTIEHYNAVAASPGVTPAIPATPSVIVGVTFISAQFPLAERVAPLGISAYGQIGEVSVLLA